MAAAAALRPIGRIGAAEPVHRVLHAAETQVVGEDLDDQQHDVDVVEEVQVDMRNVEGLRLGSRLRERHPDLGDVVATEHA